MEELPLWHSRISGVLGATGAQVQSLTWHSGLAIQCCCSYILGCHSGSDLFPGQGAPYATGWPKMTKKKKKKKDLEIVLCCSNGNNCNTNKRKYYVMLTMCQDRSTCFTNISSSVLPHVPLRRRCSSNSHLYMMGLRHREILSLARVSGRAGIQK